MTVTLTLHRVAKGPQGEERLEPAGKVQPGELLEYRAVYRNDSASRLDGVLGTLPVPEGMEYEPRSASPGTSAEAATGDGRFAAEPLMRQVRRSDGTIGVEQVPVAEYRALRWNLGTLVPRQSVSVSARVRVAALTEPTARAGEGS